MLKKILIFSGASLTLIIILAGWGLYSLNEQIQERMKHRMFEPPIEFYSAPKSWVLAQTLTRQSLEEELTVRGVQKVKPNQVVLRPGQLSWLDQLTCLEAGGGNVARAWDALDFTHCAFFKNPSNRSSLIADAQLVAFTQLNEITAILNGHPWVAQEELRLEPLLFAQYYKDRPVLQTVLPLSEFPAMCLKSVLAIEDPKFLDHSGISPRGLARAIIKNVIMGDRSAGGGSTITQQLMKIYFLSSEQTYSRKIKDIGMAILFETKIAKDKILEAYLNMIYMGQSGTFAVKGFPAAAKHYFRKNIQDLNLAECSSLAAILNSPGRYSPFRHPDRTKKRRQRVLSKMLELDWIDQEEFDQANSYALPEREITRTEPAPYFVDAVRRQMRSMDLNAENGLKVFTTMVPEAQLAARKAVQGGIKALEDWFKHLQENKEQKKLHLQSVLAAANPRTGHIEALIGGREFKSSPYNRAVRAHRQVGSVIKPFVYLAALESLDPQGRPYTPMTILKDKRFKYKYENQEWAPKNYGNKYFGDVPMYFSLMNSLNCSTARMGISIGLTTIIDLAKRMGVESKIGALPAMTLGAYELYPIEVLKAYTAIARFGSLIELSTIERITDPSGDTLWKFDPAPQQVASSDNVAALVGMMKNTVESGTAQAIRRIGFKHPAAGKTGTTSDARDAWFSGITPYHVAITWVGYDENEIHGLTGASGAVPIWTKYMMEYASRFPNKDFAWPENAIKVSLSVEEQRELGFENAARPVELVFRGSTEP